MVDLFVESDRMTLRLAQMLKGAHETHADFSDLDDFYD